MLSRLMRVLSTILMLTSFMLTVVSAQTSRGTITGHVTDSGGAVVPNAKVQLQPRGTSTTTDPNGDFKLSDVATGEYTLTVSYAGREAFSIKL
jgi:hypothetical protein